MKWRSIVGEAGANLRTGTTRAWLLGSLLTVVLLGLTFADTLTVAALSDQADRYQDAGGSTLIYESVGRIDGAACESLSGTPGVQAAGALRTASAKLSAAVLPGNPIPAFEVSPHFGGFRALSRRADGVGIALSDEAMHALGARIGDTVQTAQGSARVAANYEYPDDGRRPGLGYAALVPTDDRAPFDECWAQIWPESTATSSILRATLRPQHGAEGTQPPKLFQLNASLGGHFDGAARYDGRITRYAPFAVAVAGVLLGFAAIRSRRLELASARHAGVTIPAQTGQLLLETGAWTLAAVTFAVILTMGSLSFLAPAISSTVLALTTQNALAAALAVAGGALIALSATREEHLFRYSKSR